MKPRFSETPQPPKPEKKRPSRLVALVAGTLAVGLPKHAGDQMDEQPSHIPSTQERAPREAHSPDVRPSVPKPAKPEDGVIEEFMEKEQGMEPEEVLEQIHRHLYETLTDDAKLADWILEKGMGEDVQDSYSDEELQKRIDTYVDWLKTVRMHSGEGELEIFIDGVSTMDLFFVDNEDGVQIKGHTIIGPMNETLETPDQVRMFSDFLLGLVYSECIVQFKSQGEPIE